MKFYLALMLSFAGVASAQTSAPPAGSTEGPCVAPACIDFTVTLPGVKADGVTLPIPDPTGQTPTERGQDPQCLKCKPLTLSEAATRVLLASLSGDRAAQSQAQPNPVMTTEQTTQMNARSRLVDKIADNPRAVLTDDERLVICHRADMYWGGSVPRRVLERVCPKDEDLTAPVKATSP